MDRLPDHRVDTKKAKISSTDNHIAQPHAEMVFIADLRTGNLQFTGKSYPTPNQEKGLLRIQDLGTHFVKIAGTEAMILGCHDLTMYNPRSDATVVGWCRRARYLCEPKRASEMTDEIVQLKAKAATLWCQHASRVSEKPWRYLLIPHDAIELNATFLTLSNRYGLA